MADIKVVEVNYSNELHNSDFLALMESYARDPFGLGEPLGREVKISLIDELKNIPGAFSLLAYSGEKPTGLANCFVLLSTLDARKLVNIHDLFVLSNMRGKGVGEKLLHAIQQKARGLNCCRLTLEVREENEAAIRLYERFGFDDDYQMWSLVKEL